MKPSPGFSDGFERPHPSMEASTAAASRSVTSADATGFLIVPQWMPRRPRSRDAAGRRRSMFFLELQRHRVHAVAQAGGRRAVVEHVTQMAAASRAAHLVALHAE